MTDNLLTEPYRETFVMDDEPPELQYRFVCNQCHRLLDDGPCPDHAPRDIPGLDLVECEKNPRHWVWVLASDANGYGIPCWQCITEEASAERNAAENAHNQAWFRRWRYWAVARRTARWASSLGIIGGYGLAGHERGWRLFGVRIRGRRNYILGVTRETWRCWLIGHHRRGEEVGLGFCGKCVPWPCCGSIREAHKPGCPEDV